MSDNWINRRLLTSQDAIYDGEGYRLHDLIDLEVEGGNDVDAGAYPVLVSKLNSESVVREVTKYSSSTDEVLSVSKDGTTMYQYGEYDGTGYSLWKSTDSGVTFTEVNYFEDSESYRGIDCSDDGVIVYIVVEGGLRRSIDGGVSFVDITSSAYVIANIACNSSGSTVIANHYANGRIYRSVDGSGLSRMYGLSSTTFSGSLAVLENGTEFYSAHYQQQGVYKISIGSDNTLTMLDSNTNITNVNYLQYFEGKLYTLQDDVYIKSTSGLFETYDTYSILDGTPYNGSVITIQIGSSGITYQLTNNIYSEVSGIFFPLMPRPTGSPHPYKIIADAT